jgi:hypothetical protein
VIVDPSGLDPAEIMAVDTTENPAARIGGTGVANASEIEAIR